MCPPLPVRGRVLAQFRSALESHGVGVRHAPLAVLQLALYTVRVGRWRAKVTIEFIWSIWENVWVRLLECATRRVDTIPVLSSCFLP